MISGCVHGFADFKQKPRTPKIHRSIGLPIAKPHLHSMTSQAKRFTDHTKRPPNKAGKYKSYAPRTIIYQNLQLQPFMHQ